MRIVSVKYIRDYILEVIFYTNEKRVVDLADFMNRSNMPFVEKYRKISNFRKVRVEDGCLAWGNNEFDFSGEGIYNWNKRVLYLLS